VPLKKIAKNIAGKASHELRIAGETRGCAPPPTSLLWITILLWRCASHLNIIAASTGIAIQQRSYSTARLFNSAAFQQLVSGLLHQLAHTKLSQAPIMD